MTKNIFVVISMLLFNVSITAQINKEQDWIFYLKQFGLSTAVIPKDSFSYALSNIACDSLYSNGFPKHIKFYRIYNKSAFNYLSGLMKQKNMDSLLNLNRIFYLCEYVVAVNYLTNDFYKLKGFEENDFDEFYCIYILQYKVRLKLKKEDFLLKFYVDRLDLSCLYDGLNSKKKLSCCKSCYARDKDLIKAKLNLLQINRK